MSKTYYTVEGQVWGEHRSGESDSRDYLHDALGNVVAVFQNGWEIAEAFYKPHGEFAGQWNFVAHGYRFAWVGAHGYRRTNMAYVTHYIRARHYSQIGANWTTRDPLWPREMAYGYVSGRVMSGVDPSGKKCIDYGGGLKFIKENCKTIKQVARSFGIPCNLLATTIFLERPGAKGWMADDLWANDLTTKASVGVPQVTVYPDGYVEYDEKGKPKFKAPINWQLSEVYSRIKDRPCCKKAINDFYKEWKLLGKPEGMITDVALKKRCVANCLYNDPEVWASEASRHLQEDCHDYVYNWAIGHEKNSGYMGLSLAEQALVSHLYKQGNFKLGKVNPGEELKRARAGGRSKDFLDCYDSVNKQCCND